MEELLPLQVYPLPQRITANSRRVVIFSHTTLYHRRTTPPLSRRHETALLQYDYWCKLMDIPASVLLEGC